MDKDDIPFSNRNEFASFLETLAIGGEKTQPKPEEPTGETDTIPGKEQ